MGHGPWMPRVGQASNQAIKVKDRADVIYIRACGQILGKAPRQRAKRFKSHATTKQTTSTLPGQFQTSHPNTYRRFSTLRLLDCGRPELPHRLHRPTTEQPAELTQV